MVVPCLAGLAVPAAVTARTVRLLGPRQVYREFLEAVIELLPRMRFRSPLYRGCKVKQMVQLPCAFKLNR